MANNTINGMVTINNANTMNKEDATMLTMDDMNTMVNEAYKQNRERKGIVMTNNDMKAMVVDEINRVDSVNMTDSDDEILDIGLAVADMEWDPKALEWLARTWSGMIDEDNEEIAGCIIDWQLGYRCEDEDQPSILLAWAATHDTERAHEVNKIIRSRIQPMIMDVENDLVKGIRSDKAWQAAIENGCISDDNRDYTEYEIRLAAEIVNEEYENKLLLEVLKDHTIKNAIEVAHQIWKDGDEDGVHDELIAAIERCQSGGMDADDWNLLVEYTEF